MALPMVSKAVCLCMIALLALVLPAAASVSVCRDPLLGSRLDEPAIMVWDQETMIAFGSGFRDYQGAKPGVEGPWLAPLITGLVLCIITAYLCLYVPEKPPIMYWTMVFYPFATALVEFARVNFDASRYGFLTATWHNLPEYIIIFHLFMTKPRAEKAVPWILLWVWALDVFILFVPSMLGLRGPAFGGLVEQITGICCDHILMFTFTYLWRHEENPNLKSTYGLGAIAAFMHMLEIGPLVILLSGLVSRPYIPICALVAFTTPITFYLYAKFAKQWCDPPSRTADKPAIPRRPATYLLAMGIVLGLLNIFAPRAIPYCVVPPGGIAFGGRTMEGVPPPGAPTQAQLSVAPIQPPLSGAPTQPQLSLASNKTAHAYAPLYCLSKSKLTGTTTVVAKPGLGQELLDMVATMPGPIRQEEGNIYYEEAFGLDRNNNTVVKFFESWSSIRSLYKHIYTSDAVSHVFRSQSFGEIIESQTLEGPFQALTPCDVVQQEAAPVTVSFEVVLDGPIDCVWSKISNWCGDVSWLPHALGVKCVNTNLRTVSFGSTNVTEILQAPPLSAVEQPQNGHRLVYYLISGGFVDALNLEVYRGDVTLESLPQDPSKTLYKYQVTYTAKDSSKVQSIYDTLQKQYPSTLLPGLAKWASDTCSSANTEASPQAPGTPCSNTSSAPTARKEYYMMFELNNATKAALESADTADEVVKLLLPQKGDNSCLDVQLLYAAKTGSRNLYQRHNTVPGPDFSDKSRHWDVVVILRLGPNVSPESIGAGVAVRSYHLQVMSKPLPSQPEIAQCKDTDDLKAAIEEVRPVIDQRVEMFAQCHEQSLIFNATGRLPDGAAPCPIISTPEDLDMPRSGVNLLKLKDGMLGWPCYAKYVYEAWELIHKYSHQGKGGIAYYGQVVHDKATPAKAQWDAIVIPIYDSAADFFNVLTHPKYYDDVLLRDATVIDDISVDVHMLPGSIMQLP